MNWKKQILLQAVMFAVALPTIQAADAEDYPRCEAVECHPRSGLPNFCGKAEAGETVRIAYLGGSITAAPGWRVQSREWFQARYPETKFEEIHAAIGGTGSDLGVFRLQNDALRHKPDLLFVEFAVNDHSASPEQIQKAMEGIVRQTWRADPTIDICFVYTVHLAGMHDLRSGRMQRSASALPETCRSSTRRSRPEARWNFNSAGRPPPFLTCWVRTVADSPSSLMMTNHLTAIASMPIAPITECLKPRSPRRSPMPITASGSV